MSDIEVQLKQVMADIFEVSAKEIDDESSPETLINWDSLQHLNLIVAIEETFNINLSPEDVTEMLDFTHIKEIVVSRVTDKRE